MDETVRSLASVVQVDSVSPIDGADRIDLARVKGWSVVVGKGQFSAGDIAVYFEIDSALPVNDERFNKFAERSTKNTERGPVHVLGTVKLRGQVSQGLLMGLEELGLEDWLSVGDDVTAELGITKWEPEVGGKNSAVGSFLTQFADKTDSERVQNLTDEFLARIAPIGWVATEKVDGTSVTIVKTEDGQVRVCSRNQEVGEDSLHFNHVKRSGIPERMEPGDVFQGEIVGPGIQGNRLKIEASRIVLFDLWRDRQIIPREEWPQWAQKLAVPVLDIEFPRTVDQAIEQANKIRSVVNPNVQAEGVVWHTSDGSVVPELGRSTWKAINNAYLLKGG